jgi:hypothetical protein
LTLYDVWRLERTTKRRIQHDAYMSSRRSSERTASEQRVNTIDVDAPPSTASEGRHISNKKAKDARDAVTSWERVQASIDRCLADVSANSIMRDQKSDARWVILMEKQDNIELART